MRFQIPEIKNKSKEVIAMSLSSALRASTKWLWQQALIRAGGQDIATQLRERRIGCSSINDWLASQFPFLWDCVTHTLCGALATSLTLKFLHYSLFLYWWVRLESLRSFTQCVWPGRWWPRSALLAQNSYKEKRIRDLLWASVSANAITVQVLASCPLFLFIILWSRLSSYLFSFYICGLDQEN